MKSNFTYSKRLFYAPNLFLTDDTITFFVKKLGSGGGFSAMFSADSFDNGDFFKKVCSFPDLKDKLNKIVNFSCFIESKKTLGSGVDSYQVKDLGISPLLTQLPQNVVKDFSFNDITKFENATVPFWSPTYLSSKDVSGAALIITNHNIKIQGSSDANHIPMIIDSCNSIIPKIQEFECSNPSGNKIPYSFSRLLVDYNLGEIFIESLIEVIEYIDGNPAPVNLVVDSLIKNLTTLYRNHVDSFFNVDYKQVYFDNKTTKYFISTLMSNLLTKENSNFITAISVKENHKTGFTFSKSGDTFYKPCFVICKGSTLAFSGVSTNVFRKKPSVIQPNSEEYKFSTLSGIKKPRPTKDFHFTGNFNIDKFEDAFVKRPKYYSTKELREFFRKADSHFILVCDALNRTSDPISWNAVIPEDIKSEAYVSQVNSSILFLVNSGVGLPGTPSENFYLMRTFCSSDTLLSMFKTYRYINASGRSGVTYGKQSFFSAKNHERNIIVARKCTYTFYKVFREFADAFYLNDNPAYPDLYFDYENNNISSCGSYHLSVK
ncbi:hypothetical protein AB834_03680 [PVC group bacterium (ex Bugula neritina AB1)]|nr:hypothetical protein AB834_03680 [PVC group bacterium (ex Bugula neritina AB1)]